MSATKFARVTIATVALLLASAAQAQQGTLEVRNEAFLQTETVAADGTRSIKRVPAGTVVPGAEVLYVVTLKNVGKAPAQNLSVDNPVPQYMVYVPESAAGDRASATVSVDGGKRYDALTALTMPAANGGTRPAQAADVTHLRWTLNYALSPGQEGVVTFKARLQ